MNAEQTRVEAIERIARAVRADDLAKAAWRSDGAPRHDWDALSERMRDEYRAYAAPLVDALGDLLRTEPEAYVVVSKRGPDEEPSMSGSGPWDGEATVFTDHDAASDMLTWWEVDQIQAGRDPNVFVLGEVRFERTPLNREWLQAALDQAREAA